MKAAFLLWVLLEILRLRRPFQIKIEIDVALKYLQIMIQKIPLIGRMMNCMSVWMVGGLVGSVFSDV